MKTAELTGAQLDYWVARAIAEGFCEIAGFEFFNAKHADGSFHYSTEWSLGGPIIEREWRAITAWLIEKIGPNWRDNIDGVDGDVLRWFMRAYVGNKYGDEVPSESV